MSKEQLKVFFYSCLEFDKESQQVHVHSGLHAAKSREKVMDDIADNFVEPQYISVTQVPELAPTFDGKGDPVGYMYAEPGNAQAPGDNVDNMEGGEDEND